MSNEAPDDEVAPQDKESASKQSTTLNETTSREKGEHDVVIICSIRSRPIPLNYASLTVVTKEQVQDMIGVVVTPAPVPTLVSPTLKLTPLPPLTQPPPPPQVQD
ncbi:hypothetical protein HKD37_01G001792 [Glycine soja]